MGFCVCAEGFEELEDGSEFAELVSKRRVTMQQKVRP